LALSQRRIGAQESDGRNFPRLLRAPPAATSPPRRRAAEDRDERAPLQSNSLAYPCRPATVIEITADFNDDVDRLFVATCSIGYSRLITNRLATINR
jgi:hypothetical protein